MPNRGPRFSDKPPTPAEFNQMRETVGWGPILPTRHAATALEHSLFCVSVYIGKELVGMGRVIGDRGYVFLLQEIVVLEEHRGQGIGSRIVQRLLERIDELGLERAYVVLMSSQGHEGFYERFGFERRPSEHRGAGMSQVRMHVQQNG